MSFSCTEVIYVFLKNLEETKKSKKEKKSIHNPTIQKHAVLSL